MVWRSPSKASISSKSSQEGLALKKKKRMLQTLFDKDYSENDNEKSGKTIEVWFEKGAMH